MAECFNGECNPPLPRHLVLSASDKAAHAPSSAADALRAEIESWFQELRAPIYFYLLGSGASPQDADELTQETFIRLLEYRRAGNTLQDPRPWLFRVSRNLLIDRDRRRRREAAVAEEEWFRFRESLADPKADLETSLLSEERRSRVARALADLTPLQIQYLHLRAEGLRYREIAEIYSVGISSVVDVVRRAVERLGKEVA